MYQYERCFLQLRIPYVTCLRFSKYVIAGAAGIVSVSSSRSSCIGLGVRSCRIQPKPWGIVRYLFCILSRCSHITHSELPRKTDAPSVCAGKLAEIYVAGIICRCRVFLYIYKRRGWRLIILVVGALTYHRKYFKRSWEYSSAFSRRIEGEYTVYLRLHVCWDVGTDVICI